MSSHQLQPNPNNKAQVPTAAAAPAAMLYLTLNRLPFQRPARPNGHTRQLRHSIHTK